jgi:hypothetical protein
MLIVVLLDYRVDEYVTRKMITYSFYKHKKIL